MEPTESSDVVWNRVLDGVLPFVRKRLEKFIDLSNPPPFLDLALEALSKPGPLSSILLEGGLVIRTVLESLSSEDAIRLACAASRIDNHLDDKIMSALTRPSRQWPGDVPEAEIVRALDLVDAISDCRRLVIPLMKFVKLPQPRLRSKAVKLIARASHNPGWVELILSDPDPRVRANLVDGIARQQGPQIRNLLQRAASDPHHRVAVAALVGLSLRGDRASLDMIYKLNEEGTPEQRKAAEWALSQLKQNAGDRPAA